MIRKNNKGLSLVELIVAVAILAIVGVGIMGFVSFSSRNYTQANKNVKLQYEQQMTVNRIRDIVLETSRAIAYDDTTHSLTVFSDTAGSSITADGTDVSATPIIVSRIFFTEAAEGEDAGTLSLLTAYLSSSDIQDKKYSDITISGTGDILTDTVKEFSADLSNVGKGKVTLHITFKVGEKEIEVHPEIALRNQIDVIGSESKLDEIYTKEIIEFTSNVAKVEISRDGKKFGQAKTDTINMAGDTTSVDYDAVVTKKSYYKGDIDTSVTWELEGLKEGYEACIILDSNTGLLTLKNAGGKKPADYMNGETFTIKAISNEDPTKIARLRIKVGTNGVYPKKITYAETNWADLLNAQRVYKFTHTIEYTAKIKNLAGQEVNPLTGDDVYSKIKYTVYAEDKTTLANIPKGAGFSATQTDGVFRVVKSMEKHTYNIKASVLQKDKDGQEVFCWIELVIPEGAVPDDDTELTIPQLYTLDEYRRADYNAASVQWTKGVPTYRVGNDDYQYYYWYEWEIEPVDGWGNSSRDKFNGNVYLYSGGNKGTSYTSYMTDRMSLIYIEPKLNWANTFTMRVSVRAKLAKTVSYRNENYYVTSAESKLYRDNTAANTVIGTINNGDEIEIISEEGNFCKIRVGGIEGYINAKKNDLNEVTAYNTRRSNVKAYVNDWGWSGGWDENNPSNFIIPTRGTELNVTNNPSNQLYDSARISWNGGTYYIKPNDYNIIKKYYTRRSYTVYEKASTTANVVLTTIPATSEVSRLQETNNVYRVTYDGLTGYIFKSDALLQEKTRKFALDTNSLYYKLPQEMKETYDMEDITTNDKSEAYVSSKLVTINPVKLTLTPAVTQFYKHNTTQQTRLTAYFNTDTTVYLGKGYWLSDFTGYNVSEDYRYYNVTNKGGGHYSGYQLDSKNPNDSEVTWYSDYYKCFTPSFTGIKVDRSNYQAVLGNVRKTLDGSGTSALQPYVYDQSTGTTPQNLATTEFDSGYIFNVDNQLYFYVKMTPYNWGHLYTTYPSGVRWTCVVEGKDSANFVKANTVNGEYYYFNYTAKKELDPTATN
ncbi:MAG: SH3 domain-containing protein [Lachnospiraceae bacterium]|nr:SH3 domain-containing protein [Lachnospiraceae bacterium]